MNGVIEGEIVMNAAIYQKPVCEVCLNCPYARCINAGEGCQAFRDVMAESRRRTGRRKGSVDRGEA